jgi:uncharacterized protein
MKQASMAGILPDFTKRYGRWAVIAGASVGLGAAFARAAAARGMNLFLIARRKAALEILAEECRRKFNVEARILVADLGSADSAEDLGSTVAELDAGLLVYNAAFAPVGEFALAEPAELMKVIDVNVRGPVTMLRAMLPAMIGRKRGALVLMSSLAGNQGSPRLAAYSASKAFNKILAEGLWHELKKQGIDIVACCAGAIRTPGYSGVAGKSAPGTLDPETVAEKALQGLGKGPLVVPGFINRLAAFFLGRLASRRAAIRLMASNTKSLISASGSKGQT